MTNYMTICFAVYAFIFLAPSRWGGGPGIGGIFLAVLWPMIPVILSYVAFKRFVLKRRGFHPIYGELEVSACALVACALIFYVCLSGGPILEFFKRPL